MYGILPPIGSFKKAQKVLIFQLFLTLWISLHGSKRRKNWIITPGLNRFGLLRYHRMLSSMDLDILILNLAYHPRI